MDARLGQGLIQAQQCKTDYEAIILNQREKMTRNRKLRVAIKKYFQGNQVYGEMAELLGELTSEAWYIQATIDRLIEQQEKEEENHD
jgi:hypothetical protein